MVSDDHYKIFNMNSSLRSPPSLPLAPARGREFASNGLSGFNLIIVAVCITLAGCMGADTRGSEAPDHIRISGTPTWTNGIGELMTKKCATCHQVPRLASSPTNVTTDMDLRYEITSGAIRAATDIAAQIKLRILRNALHYGINSTLPVRAMPLSQSTPLYADEITALETWADSVIAQANTSPPPTDGALQYKRHCQSCHGMYGAGGVVNRPLRTTSGPTFATYILATSAAHPMRNWPLLMQFANACTPTGAPTTCNGNQLDTIAAYLNTQ